MQLLHTTRDALLKPLSIVSNLVDRRHILPILANLLIRKEGETIAFIASDQDIQITTTALLGTDASEVATTVAARKLLDILRSLPDIFVTLTQQDTKIIVQAGKSRFSLQTLNAEDFPVMARAQDAFAQLQCSQKTLKYLLDRVYFSMAQNDVRYYLNGLLFTFEGNQITASTTDGHRLAYCHANLLDIPKTVKPYSVILPRKTVLECQRLLEDSDDPVHITLSSQQIKCTFGACAHIELLSKLVEGKFPELQGMLRQEKHTHRITTDREPLLRALQRVALMTTDKFKGIRWVIEPGLLRITSVNMEQEEAVEEVDIHYNGPALDAGFNVTYLLDILTNLKTEHITIAMNHPVTSAIFTVPDHPGVTYLVMPMKI